MLSITDRLSQNGYLVTGDSACFGILGQDDLQRGGLLGRQCRSVASMTRGMAVNGRPFSRKACTATSLLHSVSQAPYLGRIASGQA
jgi:hypothetical protein